MKVSSVRCQEAAFNLLRRCQAAFKALSKVKSQNLIAIKKDKHLSYFCWQIFGSRTIDNKIYLPISGGDDSRPQVVTGDGKDHLVTWSPGHLTSQPTWCRRCQVSCRGLAAGALDLSWCQLAGGLTGWMTGRAGLLADADSDSSDCLSCGFGWR